MENDDVNHTGDSTLLRRVNASAVLELIRESGPITRSEIARLSRLSLPTITRIVVDLIAEDLVREHSAASSRGGRRPTLLEFNFRSTLVIGVYVGRNMVAALADLDGTILRRASVASLPGEPGLERLVGLIRGLLAEADSLGIRVRGVGVGVPSIVEYPQGVVVLAPTLGWRNLPLRRRLEDELGVPTLVQNEINLLTLGESWRGAGRNIRNLACISLGAGIGAGLVIDGQVYSGSHFAAGEIGYAVPSEQFLGRSFETFGCLESVAGGDAIVRRAESQIAAGQPYLLPGKNGGNSEVLTIDAVFSAARAGIPLACALVREAADYWSVALANLACIVDPARIIISGELAEYSDLFVDHIRDRLSGLVPAMPDVVVSDLRMDAAVLGAVAVVMRETSNALFVHPSWA